MKTTNVAKTAAITANVTGNKNGVASVRMSSVVRDASMATQDANTAASIFGDTLGATGGGGGDDDGRDRSSLSAERMAAARASKLARAEAEAYADVQVHVYLPGRLPVYVCGGAVLHCLCFL